MPKYQMYFDVVSGETKYNVDIDEGETLDAVLEEILFDLRERGDVLKGDGIRRSSGTAPALILRHLCHNREFDPTMSCASAPLLRTASFGLSNSPLERRLEAEWDLLQRLVDRNPGRLTALTADDLCFRLRLLGTPGFLLAEEEHVAAEHEVVLVFPRFFPAAPLECYLRTPVQHPNIHPETGFVCLWDRHRASNTVEHALHKAGCDAGMEAVQPGSYPRDAA